MKGSRPDRSKKTPRRPRDAGRAAWSLVAVLAGLGFVGPIGAQETPPSVPPPAAEETTAPQAPESPEVRALRERIAALEAAEPTEDVLAELAALRTALTHLSAALEYEAAIPEPADVAAEEDRLEAALAALGEDAPTVPEGTEDQLRAALARAETELKALRGEREALVAADAARPAEQADLLAQIDPLEARLEEVRRELAAPPDPSRPEAVADARETALRAEARSLEAQLAAVRGRMDELAAEAALAPARRDLLEARLERSEALAAALEERLERLELDAARRAEIEAAQAARAAADLHPVVREVLVANEALAADVVEVLRREDAVERDAARVDDALALWRSVSEESRELVANAGRSTAVGYRLRGERARLPDLHEHREAMDEREATIADVSFALSDLRYQALQIGDAASEARRRLAAAGVPAAEREVVLAALEDAFAARLAHLESLQEAYGALLGALTALQTEQAALVETVDELRDFLDEQVLWIQSAPALNGGDLVAAWDALRWLASPGAWLDVATELGRDARRAPAVYVAILVAIVALLVLSRRLRRRQDVLARRTAHPTLDRFVLTVEAVSISALRAGAWPIALTLLAWRVDEAAGGAFPAAVAAGVRRVAFLLFAAVLLYHLLRPGGVAGAHLGWRREPLEAVRRNIRWAIPIGIPLVFLLTAADASGVDAFRDSLGRLAFILAMIVGSIFLARVFRPGGPLVAGVLQRHREGWIDRLRWLWYGALVALPPVLAAAAAAGYFYTAVRLERRLLESTWLLLSVLFAHALLVRWVGILQARLALEHARKHLAEQARTEEAPLVDEAPAAGTPTPPPASEIPPAREAAVDVEAISEQTRRLLRNLAALVAIVGLVVVWAEVLPAFGILRNVTLWETTETVAAAATVVDPVALGAAVETAETVTRNVPITLAHVAIALLAAVATFFVARNLPGLMEITLLQRLPITAGARYAVTTLSRYAIVIVGLVIAFNAIGIGWSKVQWLAAAATVGLGFGLQEIFANFVSGIIILFERPVRVGDTVTVGQISGTVARVRMRATTITDWDRKELIIPNKEFVTGQVVNWTLSDQILRAKVLVGIAYGSDVARAKEILLRVAGESPHVLKDPPPQALFLGFGDSTLSLELRAFVSHIEHLLQVRDWLHTRVNDALNEAGIEIAFPQRDIHIRSIESALPIEPRGPLPTA